MVNVTEAHIFMHEQCPNGGIRLFWEGDAGFGTYDLVFETRNDEDNPQDNYKLKISGYSECMDSNDDKKFIKELLMSLVDFIEIVE